MCCSIVVRLFPEFLEGCIDHPLLSYSETTCKLFIWMRHSVQGLILCFQTLKIRFFDISFYLVLSFWVEFCQKLFYLIYFLRLSEFINRGVYFTCHTTTYAFFFYDILEFACWSFLFLSPYVFKIIIIFDKSISFYLNCKSKVVGCNSTC